MAERLACDDILKQIAEDEPSIAQLCYLSVRIEKMVADRRDLELVDGKDDALAIAEAEKQAEEEAVGDDGIEIPPVITLRGHVGEQVGLMRRFRRAYEEESTSTMKRPEPIAVNGAPVWRLENGPRAWGKYVDPGTNETFEEVYMFRSARGNWQVGAAQAMQEGWAGDLWFVGVLASSIGESRPRSGASAKESNADGSASKASEDVVDEGDAESVPHFAACHLPDDGRLVWHAWRYAKGSGGEIARKSAGGDDGETPRDAPVARRSGAIRQGTGGFVVDEEVEIAVVSRWDAAFG